MLDVIKILVASSAMLAVAPPENPSWLKEVTDEDMELLMLHMVKADEITKRDTETVACLYFESQVLATFEHMNREVIKSGADITFSSKEILSTIEKIREAAKTQISNEEKKKLELENKMQKSKTLSDEA